MTLSRMIRITSLCLFALLLTGLSNRLVSQELKSAESEAATAESNRTTETNDELDLSKADPELLGYAKNSVYERAYGMYVRKSKLGWSVEKQELGMHQGMPVLITSEESHFATQFFGEEELTTSKSTTIYSLVDDGAIVYEEDSTVEDGKTIKTVVEPENGKLKITRQIGEQASVRLVDIPKDNLRRTMELEKWMLAERKPGDTFNTYSHDFEELDVDVEETVTFRTKHELIWEGEPINAFDLDVAMFGATSRMTIDEDGVLLKATMGEILEILAEPIELAKNMEGKPVDLFAASAIQIDQDLGDSENVDRLVLKVRNLGEYKIPESRRQKTQQNDDHVLLTLVRGSASEVAEPLTEEEMAQYVASTPATLCDHPVIVARMERIVKDETDTTEKAKRISRWVYRNLNAAGAANASTSLQVLEQRAGDCSEHSLLFVALARAAGIPAREVSGVMYAGEDQPYFAWHAWAEIHDGKQWVTVDPTWNQYHVDATHIKLGSGSTDLSWANLVGTVEFEVVEVEHAK